MTHPITLIRASAWSRRLGRWLLLGVALLLLNAAAAAAATLAVSASPNPGVIAAPGGAVYVTVKLSGSSDAGSAYLDLYYQAGQADCAATTDSERTVVDATGASATGSFPSLSNGGTVGQGPFDTTDQHRFLDAQTYRLCAYMTPNSGGGDAGTPDAAATAILTVSGPSSSTGSTSPGTTTTASTGSTTPATTHAARCVVPRLAGRTLASATRALKAAGCRLGRVRRVHARTSRRGLVVSQSPAPGRRLSAGAKVNVSVGRS